MLKKRKFFAQKALAVALFAAASVFLFSCKSTPDLAPVDPFDLLRTDAALYLSVPVPQNIDFVTRAIQKFAGTSESDAKKIAERLELAYVAVGAKGDVQFSAKGNIPVKMAGLVLTEKNGWKGGTSSGQVYFTHSRSRYELCLPSSSNAFLSYDIAPMIQKYNRFAYADFPPEKLTAEQTSSISSSEKLLSETLSPTSYKFLHENASADIVAFSPNPKPFIKSFVGFDVNVGVNSVYAVLSQYRGVESQFTVKLILNLSDARTVKATTVLLKTAMFGMPAKVVQSGQSQITITDLPVPREKILSMLQ